MKPELKLLIGDTWLVEVQEDAVNLHVSVDTMGSWLIGYQTLVPLLFGKWTLLGLSDSIKKKDAIKIVETIPGQPNEPIFYKNYDRDAKPDVAGTTDWKYSFQSLLKSKSLEGRYAILKRKH